MEAYTRDECIFRELVPVGSEKLASAMAALRGRPPALSYKAIDSHTFERARIQDDHEDGQIYQFDNKEVPVAEIKLTASLPYPADLTMYPVMLGAYAVAGRAEITMVTDPEVRRTTARAALSWPDPVMGVPKRLRRRVN